MAISVSFGDVYRWFSSSDNLLNHLLILLLFRAHRALAALGTVRGYNVDRDVLNQTRVVEVDESGDRNVVLLNVVVVQDRLNRLLDFRRWETFVIFSGALGHIEVELEDVVKLVARVQVTKTLGNA